MISNVFPADSSFEAPATSARRASAGLALGSEGADDSNVTEEREASVGPTPAGTGSGDQVHTSLVPISNGKVSVLKKPFSADAVPSFSEDLSPRCKSSSMSAVGASCSHTGSAMISVGVQGPSTRSSLACLDV